MFPVLIFYSAIEMIYDSYFLHFRYRRNTIEILLFAYTPETHIIVVIV